MTRRARQGALAALALAIAAHRLVEHRKKK